MEIKIALAGNPNCGKTTLFNALTGANQYVGNWPGVTVEKKEGRLRGRRGKEKILVTDLPGVYSLSPYTLEEVVSREYLLQENPDVIVDLVGATNIERNLYLTTQLIETGVPVVVALNMADLLEKRGIRIDREQLSLRLGCPVVPISALKQTGLDDLIDQAVRAAGETVRQPEGLYSDEIEGAIRAVQMVLPAGIAPEKTRWYAIKLLEQDSKAAEQVQLSERAARVVAERRDALESARDNDMESIITDARYDWIQKVVAASVKKSGQKLTLSDRIDQIVTNRFFGLPIFVLVMGLVYFLSVSTVGTWATDWTNDVFVVAVQEWVGAWLAGIGGVIAPIFAPLGFGSWQPMAASLSGFTAKEAIVTTMGVLAQAAGDVEDPVTVAEAVAGWFPTALAGFTFLLFNLLDSPCLAAIATMAQQMQSRRWFWFAVLFQNLFAYAVCLSIYQIGSLVLGGPFTLSSAVGILVALLLLVLLFRPDPYKHVSYSQRSVQTA